MKYVDKIAKEEFLSLFSEAEKLETWFTERELKDFSFPRNAGSLAARYLIKKRICEEVGGHDYRRELEITNDSFGKPQLNYSENLKIELERAGISKILCSISHSRNYIAGMTIFCF